MSHSPTAPDHDTNDRVVFWGCFVALITTSFAFISRMYLCDVRFPTDFGIDKVTVGVLKGAGVWPFAVSIILISLLIDRVGYRVAMFFSFFCYMVYLIMACMAYAVIQDVPADQLAEAQKRGYNLLWWGSVVLGLGNGTVEAFINPVVATMFNREKTKWLNILHAGWPGGLVVGGVLTIALAETAKSGDWRLVLGMIAIPAVVYLIMLFKARFPLSEREGAGVSYREMLAEFGVFGALVGFGLIFLQFSEVFGFGLPVAAALTAVVAVGFGLYTQSMGRGILAFLIIIMMPLATTEIGTDGWIMGLMEGPMDAAGYNPGWVLVYTSAIMMVLRFFAGPIVHKLSPIGLLIASSILAIAGLLALSQTATSGLGIIFIAATLYGFGKTFFWPTMLGVTAEQCPKGGALTLNAISGIGMIAVGVLGFPFIGALQERTASADLSSQSPAAAKIVLVDEKYMGRTYQAIDQVSKDFLTATAEVADKAKDKQTDMSAEAIVAQAIDKQGAKQLGVSDETSQKLRDLLDDQKDDLSDEDKEQIAERRKLATQLVVGTTASENLESIEKAEQAGQFDALAKMAFFPAFMLICYIALFIYFKSRGGYQAEILTGHKADDKEFTGGVAGPVE